MPASESLVSRQLEMRSTSCGRACFSGTLGFEVEGVVSSSSVGSFVVGFWNAMDRKRTDSICAEGVNERMCRLNSFSSGYTRVLLVMVDRNEGDITHFAFGNL